jgi:hypothetical protein
MSDTPAKDEWAAVVTVLAVMLSVVGVLLILAFLSSYIPEERIERWEARLRRPRPVAGPPVDALPDVKNPFTFLAP